MLKNLHSFFRSFSGVKKKILRDSSGFFKSCAWDFPKIPLGCSRRTCGSSVAFCKTGAGFSLSVVIAGIPQIVAGSSPAQSMLSREGSNITANKRQFGRRGGMGGGGKEAERDVYSFTNDPEYYNLAFYGIGYSERRHLSRPFRCNSSESTGGNWVR